MKKNIILFLFIFAVSYAQDVYDADVQQYYFQILLKQWQKNSGYYQDLNQTDSMLRVDISNIRDLIRTPLKKYPNKSRGHYMWRDVRFVIVGEQYEYVLAVARYKPDYDQIWFLISRKIKRVVSEYKDKMQPEKPVENLTEEERQKLEAEGCYGYLLGNWIHRDIRFEGCPPLLPWEWWELDIWDTITPTTGATDSVTAVSIAAKAIRRCLGTGMVPVAARLMGRNKEHWMVYIYNRKKQCIDPIKAYNAGRLLSATRNSSISTETVKFRGMTFIIWRKECSDLYYVLVSKKDGQILFMR